MLEHGASLESNSGSPGGNRTASTFRVLVRHFFGRFFDTESLSPQAEAEANLGQTLALLAVPSAFFVLLFRPVTLVRWDLVMLRYYFVTLSMVVMGFIMVLEWDALFPDRRDYQILTPLPLKLRTWFLAKVAALGIFLGIFLVDVNFFGVLLWPGIDSGKDILPIMASHLVAVVVAGFFAALAAASIQGVLVTFLSGSTLRRVSTFLQTVILGSLVMLFFITPLIGHNLKAIFRSNHPAIYYFPVFWFVGLYEHVRPATGDPRLFHLGNTAMNAVWIAAAVFLLTYLPGYRRHARKVIEAPQPNPSGPGILRAAFASVSHGFFLRDPVQRAVFHFIGQTITRSMKHRLFLATYGGFGCAVAVLSLASGPAGLLQLPLTVSFVLVSALRAVFNFPSELRANWAFRISEATGAGEYAAATRKWIVVCAILPLFMLMAPLEFWWFSWKAALFHLAYGITLSVVLMEILFLGFRKVPFTCSYFPGKVNLTGLAVMYAFGFTAYSRVMASLESLLVDYPFWAAIFFAAAAGAILILGLCHTREIREGGTIDFEDNGEPAVRTLELVTR